MFLHGCRNLRFSSASFSTLFAWYFYSHGEGLSREPYSGYSHFFGTYLETFLVTIVFSVYLSVFEYFFLGYCVSCQICTWWGDSVPDGWIIDPFLSSVCDITTAGWSFGSGSGVWWGRMRKHPTQPEKDSNRRCRTGFAEIFCRFWENLFWDVTMGLYGVRFKLQPISFWAAEELRQEIESSLGWGVMDWEPQEKQLSAGLPKILWCWTSWLSDGFWF